MAAVLAILKVAWLVAAFGLVGLMGVHLGRAEAAPNLATTSTLSVDRHLVNLCEEVTFTIAYTTTDLNYHFRVYLQNIENDGTATVAWSFNHISTSANPGVTYTQGIRLCTPGRLTYQVMVESRPLSSSASYSVRAYSNTLVVQALHPADGGTERVRTVSDGGAYTNVAPVITNLDYDVPEAVTTAGATSFNASVLVKWSAAPRATGYEIVGNSPSQEVTRDTTDTEAAATQALVDFTDIYPNDERSVQTTFQVRAFLDNGESSPVILDTGTGSVAVDVGAKVYSPRSEMASIIVGREGNAAPIDTETPGDPGVVESGAAVEGINDIALMIGEKTGMGSGASTALLPLLCLLLAGVATAVVVLPLGFSPLSLFAGFLVFTLVWSIGGPAWFGIPIPMAVLFPVILAACGAMIVRGRGMFG